MSGASRTAGRPLGGRAGAGGVDDAGIDTADFGGADALDEDDAVEDVGTGALRSSVMIMRPPPRIPSGLIRCLISISGNVDCATGANATPGSGRRVLIVDDNATHRKLLDWLCAAWGMGRGRAESALAAVMAKFRGGGCWGEAGAGWCIQFLTTDEHGWVKPRKDRNGADQGFEYGRCGRLLDGDRNGRRSTGRRDWRRVRAIQRVRIRTLRDGKGRGADRFGARKINPESRGSPWKRSMCRVVVL